MAQDPLASLLQSALAKKKKETRDVLNPMGSELSKPSPMSPLATATGPISVSEPERKAPSLSEALSKTKDKAVSLFTGAQESASEGLSKLIDGDSFAEKSAKKVVDVMSTAGKSVYEGATAIKNIPERQKESANYLLDMAEDVASGKKSKKDLAIALAGTFAENVVKGGGDILSTAINLTPAGAAMNALIQGSLEAIGQKENYDEAVAGLDRMGTAIGKKMGMDDAAAERFGTTLSSGLQTGLGFLGFKKGASKISSKNSFKQNLKYASTDVAYNSIPAIIGDAYNQATGTNAGSEKAKNLLGTTAISAAQGIVPSVGDVKSAAKKGKTDAISDETVDDSSLSSKEEIEIDKKRATQAEPEAMSPKLRQATPEQMRKLGFDEKKIKSILEARGEAYVAPAAKKSKTKREDDQYAVDPKIAEAELAKTVPVKKVEKPKLFAKDKTAIRQPEPTVSKVEETAPVKQLEPVSTPEPVVSKAEPTAIAKATESRRAKNVANKKVEEVKPVEEQAPLVEEKPVVSKDMMKTRIEEGGNVIEGKEFAYNPSKLEGAKKDLESGKAKPVKLETMPDGKVSVTDGFHRVQNAVDNGLVIDATLDGKPVKFDGGIVKEEPTATELNGEQQKLAIETVTESKRSSRKKKSEPTAELEGDLFKGEATIVDEKNPEQIKAEEDKKKIAEKKELAKSTDVWNTEFSVDHSKNISSVQLGATRKILAKVQDALGRLKGRSLVRGSKLLSEIAQTAESLLNGIRIVDKSGEASGVGEKVQSIAQSHSAINYKLVNEFVKPLLDSVQAGAKDISEATDKLKGKVSDVFGDTVILKNTLPSSLTNDTYSKSELHRMFNFVMNFYNQAENLGRAEQVRDILGPELSLKIDEFKAKQKEANDRLSATVGTKLVEEGLLKDYMLVKDFEHGYVSKEVHEWLVKNVLDKDSALANMEYDDIVNLDPLSLREMVDKEGGAVLGMVPKAVSEIMKKSKDLKYLHSLGTIDQLLSYSDKAARLIANNEAVKVANKAFENPEVAKYYANIGDDEKSSRQHYDYMVKSLIGVEQAPGAVRKFETIARPVVSASRLATVAGTLFLPLMSSAFTIAQFGANAPLVAAKNWKGVGKDLINKFSGKYSFKDTKEAFKAMDDIGVRDFFDSQGAVQKAMDAVTHLTTGGTLDNVAKGAMMRMFMIGLLGKKGIEFEPGRLYETFSRARAEMDPVERASFDADVKRYVNNVSDFRSKAGHWFGNMSVMSALKNFPRQFVSKTVGGAAEVIDNAYSMLQKDVNKGKITNAIAGRAAWAIGTFYILNQIVDSFVESVYEGEDEETKNELKKKLKGGDGVLQQSGIGAVLNPTGMELSARQVSNAFTKVVKAYNGNLDYLFDPSSPVALERFIGDMMTGAAVTGSYSTKYVKTDDKSTFKDDILRALGIGKEKMQYKAYVEALNKEDLENSPYWTGLYDTLKDSLYMRIDPTKSALDVIKNEVEYANVNDVLDAYEANKDKKMDMKTWLGIMLDESGAKIDEDEVAGLAESTTKASNARMEKIAKMITDIEYSAKRDFDRSNFTAYLERLRVDDPKEFSELMKKVLGAVMLDSDMDTKGFEGRADKSYMIDTVLRDRFEKFPLLGGEISRRVDDVLRKMNQDFEGIDANELGSLNVMLNSLSMKPGLKEHVTSSVADTVTRWLTNESNLNKSLRDGKLKRTLEAFPFVRDMFIEALKLNGARIINMESTGNIPQPVTQPVTQSTTQSDGTVSGTGSNWTKPAAPALNLSKILGTKKGQEVRFSNGKSSNDVETLRKILDRTKSK